MTGNGSACISCVDLAVGASLFDNGRPGHFDENSLDSRPDKQVKKGHKAGYQAHGTHRAPWLACMLAFLDILALRAWIEHCAFDWRLATQGRLEKDRL